MQMESSRARAPVIGMQHFSGGGGGGGAYPPMRNSSRSERLDMGRGYTRSIKYAMIFKTD